MLGPLDINDRYKISDLEKLGQSLIMLHEGANHTPVIFQSIEQISPNRFKVTVKDRYEKVIFLNREATGYKTTVITYFVPYWEYPKHEEGGYNP